MYQDDIINGGLFSTSFFSERAEIVESSRDLEVAHLENELRSVLSKFSQDSNPNERTTIDTLVLPILRLLGWEDVIQEQNLSKKGRSDVPDGLLFLNEEKRIAAQNRPNHSDRFRFGAAIIETKKWNSRIDQKISSEKNSKSPSMQMLRYIRRVDDLTMGVLRWGILTNGAKWRLYYAGAQNMSEQYFELDLANILMLENYANKRYELNKGQIAHWLQVFYRVFSKNSFVISPSDGKTYHQRLITKGQFYQQRVGNSLSDKVFDTVFPILVKAIASSAPEAELTEVRDSALIILYRLLFILYAEDRELLPVHSHYYRQFGLRQNIRIPIRDGKILVEGQS